MSGTTPTKAQLLSQQDSMKETEANLKAQLAKLQAENTKLKELTGRRPDGALWLPNGTIYFPKGTRKDLVGKVIKVAVPEEAMGKFYVRGLVKESSNGNAYASLQGWIDTNKLNIEVDDSKSKTAATKAAESFKDNVVGS